MRSPTCTLQGCIAHKKQPPPLSITIGPSRRSPSVGSSGGGLFLMSEAPLCTLAPFFGGGKAIQGHTFLDKHKTRSVVVFLMLRKSENTVGSTFSKIKKTEGEFGPCLFLRSTKRRGGIRCVFDSRTIWKVSVSYSKMDLHTGLK